MIEPIHIRENDTGKRAIVLKEGFEWTYIDIESVKDYDLGLHFGNEETLEEAGVNVREIARQAPLGILQVYMGQLFYVVATFR